MSDERFRALIEARVTSPGAVAEAAQTRKPAASLLGEHGKLMMIAADHPARGALRAGPDPLAMADRAELLNRLCLALSRPGVNGVLGTADILEDLLLLGALDEKVVVGSMNRGGLAGTAFEMDDRFTAYDAQSIKAAGWNGGKMLVRIDPEDPATVRHPGGVRKCGQPARRPGPDGDDRAIHLASGGRASPQRVDAGSHDPRDDGLRRPRYDIRVHLAQSAGRGGHGARDVGDDAARAYSRRRGVCRSGCGVRSMAPGAEVADGQGPGHRPIAVVSTER